MKIFGFLKTLPIKTIVVLSILGGIAFVISDASTRSNAANDGCYRSSSKITTATNAANWDSGQSTVWSDADYHYMAFQLQAYADGNFNGGQNYFRTYQAIGSNICYNNFDNFTTGNPEDFNCDGNPDNNDYISFRHLSCTGNNRLDSFYTYDDSNGVRILPDKIEIGLPGTRVWNDGQSCGPDISRELTVPTNPITGSYVNRNGPLFECQGGGPSSSGVTLNRNAGLTDDSGRMVIDSDFDDSGSNNTTTIWCVAMENSIINAFFPTPALPAGWRDCAPSIWSSAVSNFARDGSCIAGGSPCPGYHAGAGYLFNLDGCNNHPNALVNTKCGATQMLRWYRQFLANKDITQYVRKNDDNSLRDMGVHYDSHNNHTSGYAAYTILTMRYPRKGASCTIENWPASPIPGNTYSIRVRATNTGKRPWVANKAYQPADFFLKETSSNNWTFTQDTSASPSNSVNQYGSKTVSLPGNGPYNENDVVSFNFNVTVPSGGGDFSLRMAQGYSGSYNTFGGSGCDRTVTLAPSIECQAVSPSQIELNDPRSLTITIANNGAGDASWSTVHVVVSGGLLDESLSSPSSVVAGDTVDVTTSQITATALGTYTVTINFTGSGAPSGSYSCPVLQVVRLPYLQVFGGDVQAGGVFATGDTCPAYTSTATIRAFNEVNGSSYSGSGGQLGVSATGNIENFVSSALITPPTFLTFANTPAAAGDPIYHGASGNYVCIPDYWAVAQANGTNDTNSSTSGDTIDSTNDGIYYHNGDYQIKGNIMYDTAGWSTVRNIPVYFLVVRGNIFIDPNVTQLDGIYIALPNGTAGSGTIYTCSKGTSAEPAQNPDIPASCNTALRIYGSFIASRVKFLRSFKTVSDGSAGECPIIFNAPTIPICGGTSAAEAFISGPETWLNSAISNGSGYDAITSLPPIL